MLERSELVNLLVKPPSEETRLRIGFEQEVLCFHADTLEPVRYAGARGWGEILPAVAALTGGQLEPDDPPSKVKLPEGQLISLEPGGQLEFSSAPVLSFADCLLQLHGHARLLDELQRMFDLHYFYGGVNPIHSLEQIGLVVANPRYQIMDRYFPTAGRMGRRMMRQTCSLQVTFDYPTVECGEQLLRAAQAIAPIAAGLFAHSPFLEGQHAGRRSQRYPIWQDTDPRRSGPLPGFSRPDYGFADYVQHVVAAPMFFIREDGDVLRDAGGLTFAELNNGALPGRAATVADFVLHNSTIFNDVRVKGTIEVRPVDGQDPELLPSVLALLAGLLMCPAARKNTLGRLARYSEDEHAVLRETLDREGIAGRWRGRPLRTLLLELVEIAGDGLLGCFPDGKTAGEYLQPIRRLVDEGRTPADVVLARFGSNPRAWLQSGRTFPGPLR